MISSRQSNTKKYGVVRLLVVVAPFFSACSKALPQAMPADPAVQQLTFDRGSPDQVTNEFAVASPDGKYFLVQHSEDPRLTTQPDGTKIAEFEDTSNWDIYRFRVDGSERVQLTNDPASEEQATWSPDGRTIVYRKQSGKSFDIYRMDADGTNQRGLVIDPDHDEKTPAFSRDGKKVAFYSDRDGVKWNLYALDMETREVVRLTHGDFEDKHPQYTPDGKIVFHSSRNAMKVTAEGGEELHLMHLFLLDPATGAMTQLTRSDELRDNRHPWISPDGRFVAYHSNLMEPHPSNPGMYRRKRRDIWIMTIDGKRRVNVTPNESRNYKHPSWSADGKRLFFVYKEKGQPWNAGSMDVSKALERLE